MQFLLNTFDDLMSNNKLKSENSFISQFSSDDSNLTEESKNSVNSELMATNNFTYRNDKFYHLAKNGSTMDDERGIISLFVTDAANHWKAMSLHRKTLFSVLTSLNFIVPMVFILYPNADLSDTSVFNFHNEHIQTAAQGWNISFVNEDLIGPILAPASKSNGTSNLLVTARAPLFQRTVKSKADNFSSEIFSRSVSLINCYGRTVAWNTTYSDGPIRILCSKISLQSADECLIIGGRGSGSVKSINASTGEDIWGRKWNQEEAHETTSAAKWTDKLPIILPDLDEDKFLELAAIANSSKIVIISCKTGRQLLIRSNDNCSSIEDLLLNSSRQLQYTCITENKHDKYNEIIDLENQFSPNLTDTYKSAISAFQTAQNKENISEINGYVLSVEINGTFCPMNCSAKLRVKNGTIQLWSYLHKNTFITKPITFQFRKYYGFIVKLWIYYPNQVSAVKDDVHYINSKHGYTVDQIILVLIVRSHSQLFPIESVRLHHTTIKMLCSGKQCQPDCSAQDDSMLLIDLDGNDDKELVSYFSTYDRNRNDSHDAFGSTLSVIKIEDFLKKVYEP